MKNVFFEKINVIEKLLARLLKEKRRNKLLVSTMGHYYGSTDIKKENKKMLLALCQ